jgi:CHAT domain-containing protein
LALAGVDKALEKYGDSGAEWSWRLRILKARILVSRSQNEDALKLLRDEVPPSLASTDLAEQRKLYQGIAHRGLQQFEEASQDFDDAEEMVRGLVPQYKCQLYLARAALQVDVKKYQEADASYKVALAIARNDKSPLLEVNALTAMGRLAASREHLDEAVETSQAALRLSDSLGTRGNTATILGNLAWAYFELGDFEEALNFYKDGAEQSQQSGLPGYSAYWFTGVANSYLALHEYGLAEDLARKTLERGYALKNAQTTTECLNTLAEVMLRTGRLNEAKEYNQKALKSEDPGGDTFGIPDSLMMAGQIAVAERRFADGEQFLLRVLSVPGLDAPHRWQAEAGLAEVREGQKRPRVAERLYLQAINTIETARHSINHEELRLSFLSSGIAVYGKYIEFLVRHGRPTDALREAELSRASTLEEGLSSALETDSGSQPSIHPLCIAQAENASLLFYWTGEDQSYLWVITTAKITHFILPKAAEIEPVVKSYQRTVLGMRDAQDTGNGDGKRLYEMLVEPAKKLIPQGSRVIVLPDESLYGLNFETLVVPDPQPHFWIEDVTVTTASSLTLLERSAARSVTNEKSVLLVGNTEQANPDFPPLPQAPAEMRKVEHYFPEPQRKVLEGTQATPSAYLSSNPERFAYLHFVTHGTASHTRPLESAVILSKEGDSYKLYARDILQHHLNANLVTISACNGSGTRAYSGEGLVGLSWAFLRAGAHNVIGALWEVSDASTPQLMDTLYGELSQGRDPAAALRDAKLSLLHSTDSRSVFKKPFYWAPFQLYAGA